MTDGEIELTLACPPPGPGTIHRYLLSQTPVAHREHRQLRGEIGGVC